MLEARSENRSLQKLGSENLRERSLNSGITEGGLWSRLADGGPPALYNSFPCFSIHPIPYSKINFNRKHNLALLALLA